MKILVCFIQKKGLLKTLRIFKKGKFLKEKKVVIMTKENAINYLKVLHKLEQDFSKSLFGDEMRILVQDDE